MPSKQALREAFKEVMRERLKRSLYEFVKYFWDIVVPQDKFQSNWHIVAICDHLQALAEGRLGKHRLMIFLPPRHAKSIIINVFMPAWDWTNNPTRRFLSASAKADLSDRDALKARQLIESAKYQELFREDVPIGKDKWGQSYYINNKGGSRQTTCTNGGTGLDSDFLICDDPIEAMQARSTTYRENAQEWYNSTFTTRGVQAEKTPLVLVHQRLHEDDIAGRILANPDVAKFYDVLCFPACYEENHPIKTHSSLGFVDPRTQEGELLWEARFGADWLEIEKTKGARHYNSQLQQRPSVADGEIFKEWMFPLVDEPIKKIVDNASEVVLSVDATFSDSENADCVAIICFARYGGEWYCVDGVNKQLDFIATLQTIQQMMNAYRPHQLLIEKKANGDAIIRTLRQYGIDNVQAINPKESKVARAEASTFYLSSQTVKFIKTPFSDQLIDQAIAFPNGKHDDMVDALTQFINAKLIKRQSGYDSTIIGF